MYLLQASMGPWTISWEPFLWVLSLGAAFRPLSAYHLMSLTLGSGRLSVHRLVPNCPLMPQLVVLKRSRGRRGDPWRFTTPTNSPLNPICAKIRHVVIPFILEILIGCFWYAEFWVKPQIRISGAYISNFHGGLDRLTRKRRVAFLANPQKNESWQSIRLSPLVVFTFVRKKAQATIPILKHVLQISWQKGPIRFNSQTFQEIVGSHTTQPSSGMPWRSAVGIQPCLAVFDDETTSWGQEGGMTWCTSWCKFDHRQHPQNQMKLCTPKFVLAPQNIMMPICPSLLPNIHRITKDKIPMSHVLICSFLLPPSCWQSSWINPPDERVETFRHSLFR